MLFTDKFKLSFERLNFTPSFLSRDTEATLSTEFKKVFKSTSNFFDFLLVPLEYNWEIFRQLI